MQSSSTAATKQSFQQATFDNRHKAPADVSITKFSQHN